VVVNDLGTDEWDARREQFGGRGRSPTFAAGGTAIANGESVATADGAPRVQAVVDEFGQLDSLSGARVPSRRLDERNRRAVGAVRRAVPVAEVLARARRAAGMVERGFGRMSPPRDGATGLLGQPISRRRWVA